MNSVIYTDVFNYAISQEDIYNDLNYRAVTEGDKHTPLPPILFFDEKLNSKEDAKKFIEKNDCNYAQIAVSYMYQRNFKPSIRLTEMKAEYQNVYNKYLELSKEFYFSKTVQASTECPHCLSRLTIAYLHKNVCPLCNTDLRPQPFLDELAGLLSKSIDLNKQCFELEYQERLKSIDKADLFWYVKTEFHSN